MVSNVKRKAENKVLKAGSGKEPGANFGPALRTVYEETVEEAIPQEMLDLLGKLK